MIWQNYSLGAGLGRGFDGTVPHRLISKRGGGEHSRQNLIHFATVFAALLILTPPLASAANECGPVDTTGTTPTVTCDDSDTDGFKSTGNFAIKYTVGDNTKGLKLTVEEGVDVDKNLGFGLRVEAKGALTDDNDNVEIISSGNYSAVVDGIIVNVEQQQEDRNAEIPVILNILKGVFTMSGANSGAAVKVNSVFNTGNIIIDFNGQVKGLNANKNGIEYYADSRRGGNIHVTLDGETQIGGVIGYGVKIHSQNSDETHEDMVSLDVKTGARIGTLAQPVQKEGVFVLIDNPWSTALHNVDLKHAGQLYATGHGIWVDHRWKDYSLGVKQGMNAGEKATVKANYDGGQNGKVAVTVKEGGLVVAGVGSDGSEPKDGIFISTYRYPDPDDGGDPNDLTRITIALPKLFDASKDKDLIDKKEAIAGMYHQRVIVDGEVWGGKNGAAVHMMGGGTITLGAKGRLEPHAEGTTSRSVKISQQDDRQTTDLLILLNGNFRGIQKIESDKAKTKFRYRILGGETTTYTDLMHGKKISLTLESVPIGFYNDWQRQLELTPVITDDPDSTESTNVFSLNFESKLAGLTAPTGQRQVARRGNVYQSLPSVLWDLSGGMERYVPAAPAASVKQNGEAMQFSADGAGGGNAGWVRVEGGSGDRRLKKSLGEAVSYRLSSTGFAAGADLPGDNGLSYRAGLHHRQGRAKVTGGGQIEASGIGAGFGVSKRQANGWVLDGWLGVTQYDDIKVQSSETIAGQATPFTVNAKTKGTSYALGIGAAMELALGATTVTQRGSLAWTSVSMKDFRTTYTHQANTADNTLKNAITATLEETVAMKDGSGLQGGYEVRIDTQYGADGGDCCSLFGSLGLMHDFNAKRSVSVSSDLSSETVSTETRPTSIRLGFGGSKSWNEGRSTLSGAIYHTTAGRGNSSLSGGVALAFRF